MKIVAPASLGKNTILMGDIGFPSLLIHGDMPVMFDAGISVMGPVYMKSLMENLGTRPLSMLCITHSHYDHAGSCSLMKGHCPSLKIAGHGLARDVMKNPRAISTMKGLSDVYRQMLGLAGPETEFFPPSIDLVLKDGDKIDLGGGITVRVLETPGHTRDSLTFFIEPLRAVVVGEALGVVQIDGSICPEFLTDFKAYVDSALKIINTNPSTIIMPHGPSLTGDDAATFLDGVISATYTWKDMIAESLDDTSGDIDLSTQKLFESLYDPARIGQEMNAFRTNLRAKVTCIKKLDSLLS
jgi:glyoxylase-like metal-dependent hydrolase (beta-lactamase superfamily II)